MKEVNCKSCGNPFMAFRSTDKACSMKCAKKLKAEKDLERKDRVKVVSESGRELLLKMARQVFNRYIRERDAGQPCICCGKPLGDDYHAGHFMSAGGHSALRFDEDNVHAQRADCNTGHRAGMIQEYEERLLKKIGSERLESLKTRANKVKQWTPEELRQVIKKFRTK